MIFTTSCASGVDNGGAITASAILVAVPLTPFADAKNAIYSAMSKANRERLAKKFDPVYKERNEIINNRDPIVDAYEVFNNGIVAYFSTDLSQNHGSRIYYGFPTNAPPTTDYENNSLSFKNNDLLKQLKTLLYTDQSHESEENYMFYWFDTYIEFVKKSQEYKKIFNKAMFEKYNQTKI